MLTEKDNTNSNWSWYKSTCQGRACHCHQFSGRWLHYLITHGFFSSLFLPWKKLKNGNYLVVTSFTIWEKCSFKHTRKRRGSTLKWLVNLISNHGPGPIYAVRKSCARVQSLILMKPFLFNRYAQVHMKFVKYGFNKQITLKYPLKHSYTYTVKRLVLLWSYNLRNIISKT